MSSGVGHRCGSDPMLLWLWCGLAATAPIQPLAWEFPYATGEALKRKTNKQTNKKMLIMCSTIGQLLKIENNL